MAVLCTLFCLVTWLFGVTFTERPRPLSAEQEDGAWGNEAEMRRPIKSLEVRASAHLQPRHHSEWAERHASSLEDELELARQQRGHAESLEASERREAAALARKLRVEDEAIDQAADEERHAHELLRAAKRELSRKSHEAASTHAALARSIGHTHELQQAASEAVQRARHEAEVAEHEVADQRMQTRRDLEAAKAAVAEADQVANEAQAAEALAEQEMRRSVKEQQLEHAALERQQHQAVRGRQAVRKAEEERQQHFRAAAAMRQQTQQAQALVEDAGREKLAYQRQKAHAILAEQQAHKERVNANSLSFLCYGVLAVVFIGAMGFTMQTQKGEALHHLPALLLGHLPGFAAVASIFTTQTCAEKCSPDSTHESTQCEKHTVLTPAEKCSPDPPCESTQQAEHSVEAEAQGPCGQEEHN